MTAVVLRIEPDLCGPVSVGTVGVIRVLERSLRLALPDALSVVNRAVFDGETVRVPAPSERAAAECVDLLADVQASARVRAWVEPG